VSSNFSEYPRVYTIKFTYRLAALPYKVPMRTIRNFLANETRATANEYGLGADEAIGADFHADADACSLFNDRRRMNGHRGQAGCRGSSPRIRLQRTIRLRQRLRP